MKLPVLVAALTAVCLPAHAEIIGGEANLSYSALTKHSELSRTSLSGGLEFAAFGTVSVQTDLGLNEYGVSSFSPTYLGLHGVMALGPDSAAGLFYGADHSSAGSTELYGAEAKGNFANLGIEGYLAMAKVGSRSGHQLGISGESRYSDAISFNAGLENFHVADEATITRYNLGATYAVTPTAQVSAEIGRLRAKAAGSATISEPYLAIGATFTFGQRGVTFDRRSTANLLPGG
jgi:hypothetical protein